MQIERQGETKKLIFKCNPTISIYDQIELTINIGWFGNGVIMEKNNEYRLK